MSHYEEVMNKAAAVKKKANEAAIAVTNEYNRTHGGVASPVSIPVPPISAGVGYPPQIEQIHTHFVWLADRDPEQVVAKRTALTGAKSKFKYVDQYTFANMNTEIQDGWEGDTAEVFREQFVQKLSKAYDLQMNLIDELTIALNEVEQIDRDIKRDVFDLADKTIAALEVIRKNAEATPTNNAIMFAILGASIGVASAAISGGALTFAFLSAGMSVAGTLVTDAKKEAMKSGGSITGDTVAKVLDSMFAAIGKVLRGDDTRCKAVVKGLKDDHTLTEDNFKLLSPPRPSITNGPGDMSPSRD